MHFLVDAVQGVDIELAPGDTGLVAGHDYVIAGMMQPGNRIQAARERPPFLGGLDIFIRVIIDHTVSVQND